MVMLDNMNMITLILGGTSAFFMFTSALLFGNMRAMKKGNSLITVINACKKKQKPLGLLVDKNGVMIPFMVEQDPEHVGLSLTPNRSVVLAPEYIKPQSSMEIQGVGKVLIFPMPYFFPVSVKSAAAIVQLTSMIHKHPSLSSFNNDLMIMQLMFNTSGTFRVDVQTFLSDIIGKVPIPESYKMPITVEEDEYNGAE